MAAAIIKAAGFRDCSAGKSSHLFGSKTDHLAPRNSWFSRGLYSGCLSLGSLGATAGEWHEMVLAAFIPVAARSRVVREYPNGTTKY